MRWMILAVMAVMMGFGVATAEQKMDHSGMSHGSMDGMAHDMDGEVVRSTMVDGVHLTYRLINMHDRMGKMKGMEKMKGKVASHHLMVEAKPMDGSMMHNAKVGFLVQGPDGASQKAMAMGMSGGHGADIHMMKKGDYTIKVKVKAGSKVVRDSFVLPMN